jgi:hypothetical protein
MGDESATVEVPPRPAPTLSDAAERTLAGGPARIVATVRAGRARYRVRGTWDPTVGYRVCGRLVQSELDYPRNPVLWLEGRNRSYGTLTGPGCGQNRVWFDDHPPTLPVFGQFRAPGAEDYLHAALLALGGMTDDGQIDFRAFDRDPPRRDEDGWTLRPLLRKLGTRQVSVTVNRDGFVKRLRLTAPPDVRVELRLSGFGQLPRVRNAVANAIE